MTSEFSRQNNIYKKYSINTQGKYHSEKIASNSFLNEFYYDKAFYIDSVSVDSTILRDDELKYARNYLEHLKAGNDKFLVIYRNYIDFCCDAIGPFSFEFLVNIENGKSNIQKSHLYIAGGQLPFTFWKIDSLSFNQDEIYVSGIPNSLAAFQSNEFNITLSVDNQFTIDNYLEHLYEYNIITNME